MELQGSGVDKIPEVKRERMEDTLASMDETRNEDTVRLRQVLEQRLREMQVKHRSAKDLEEQLDNQLQRTRVKRFKLAGAIEVLTSILEPVNESESENG